MCVDFVEACFLFEGIRKLDPYRVTDLDTFSNILFVLVIRIHASSMLNNIVEILISQVFIILLLKFFFVNTFDTKLSGLASLVYMYYLINIVYMCMLQHVHLHVPCHSHRPFSEAIVIGI